MSQYQVPVTFEAHNEESARNVARWIVHALKAYKIDAETGPVLKIDEVDPPIPVYYTDGGCDMVNGGVGAWAYVAVMTDGTVIEQFGGYQGTTNNRMEMLAVIKALESIEPGTQARIMSDSQYVIRGITEWSRSWIRNGWRTRDGKPVLNKDLWQKLLQLYKERPVKFVHVKGHSGHPQNEKADTLCTQTIDRLHEDIRAGIVVPVDQECHKAYA